ncbi:hypothetical protein [Lacipirellula limnantheis]|uniref:hypothetical protein n=1 Tax=Lacipirellula limnantheis TaxID=2528024 RepID=UPI001FE8B1BB|nr:hypothetical protein [Lacipirellula limnantheis]
MASKTRFGWRAGGGLPLPIDAPQLVAVLDQHGTHLLQHAILGPPLEPAVNRRVIAEFFG